MKALIVGAAGFVGGYLIDELASNNYEVYATKLPNEFIDSKSCNVIDLDILIENDISAILEKICPDVIFHLAAQSSVALSWKKPALTLDINVRGSVNLLEATRNCKSKPSSLKTKVILIGSGEEYGKVNKEENPINETNQARPGNIYAASKACQNMLGKIYADAYDMEVLMVRAFNHIGPGQSPDFVVSNFCKQTAEIEAGLVKPVINVGNLSAKRDFTDVRDIVRAYRLLSINGNGKKGETYNIGSGKAIEIKEILDIIISNSASKIEIEIDESRYRPVDVPVIEADIKKINDCTGWKPVIDLNLTITDTLQYWRSKIK